MKKYASIEAWRKKITIAFITDLLAEYGFDRVDYVYEAGQYAIRGGIADVFSFANEFPYRIEFLVMKWNLSEPLIH